MADIIHWIKNKYKHIVNLDTISIPLNRIHGFIDLKYKLGMHPTGYVYMPMMIAYNDITLIFATLYWQKKQPKFVCISPSFESSRGEFRDSFCNYTQVEKVYNEYGDILNPLLDSIHTTIKENKIVIDYGIYSNNEVFADSIDRDSIEYDSRIYDLETMGMRLLSLAIFIVNYRVTYNQVQLNTNKKFSLLVEKFFSNRVDIIFKNLNKSKNIYNNIFRNGGERPYGQKLTPLTVGEVISLGDITYKPWRELIISYAVSDMILNYISPGFSLGSNWTLIEGMDDTMFDNVILKDRIVSNSEIKKMINEYKKLYELTSSIEDVEDYRDKLLEQITDLNKNKLISKIALCKVDENVGFTFAYLPSIIRKAKVVPPHYEKLVTDIDMFNRYIFDLLYSCHVLHKRLGIIHLDLHLNNITIMKAYTFYKTNVDKDKITTITYNKKKKYNVSYVIDDIYYVLPFDGFYATIIDFSDSIINKTFLEFTDRFIERQDMEFIIAKEKDEIFDKISEFLKYADKNKDKLKGTIISDYENMFKAISTIDFVTVLRKLRISFESEMNHPKKETYNRTFTVSQDIMKKLKYMENTSLEFLLDSVQKVVSGNGKNIMWPGDVLIPDFFKSYIVDKSYIKTKNIYEAWDFNASHDYSVSTYKTYPPWLKKTDLIEKFGKNIVDDFIKEDYINDELNTQDTHLDFILESIGIESDVSYKETGNRSRRRTKTSINIID